MNYEWNVRLIVPFGMGIVLQRKSSVDDEKMQWSDDFIRRGC